MNRDASKDRLQDYALELGFSRLGVAAAGRSANAGRFLEWLDNGYHGTMDYMAKEIERRLDPRVTLEGARSVIVVTLPYCDDPPWPTADGHGKIARYARGRDYHRVMPPMLRKLGDFIGEDDRWRTWYAVDTAPILERDWAEAAGVGWIGKNGLLIDPGSGSWFFLGIVVTDRPYEPDSPTTDHCGTCRACLDACPTDAFPEPRTVDARRCISYLTIEHRGEFDADSGSTLNGWLFGCDICQEVCPYNHRRAREQTRSHPDFAPRELPTDLDTVQALDRGGFLRAFAGTPIPRTGLDGLKRNAEAIRKSAAGADR